MPNQHSDNHFDEEFVENSNTSNNPYFGDIANIHRRTLLKGGAALTTSAFFGSFAITGLAHEMPSLSPRQLRPNALKFEAVPHYTGDDMKVAKGYQAKIILPLGEPLIEGIEDWRDDRMQSGESFLYRMGDNHDGMWFFGMTHGHYDANQSERGLLAMNHEYTNHNLHPLDYYTKDDPTAPKIYQKRRLAMDVRREIHAHGVSVVELKRMADGSYQKVLNSPFNKRYTSKTTAKLSGVAKGSSYMTTKFDPKGLSSLGINNQCGAGLSPWGTFLTVEENFLNVFARGEDKEKLSTKADERLARYGLTQNKVGADNLWHTPDDGEEGEFACWDITAKADDATDDYRNMFNTFGYIVEIDPFDPKSSAIKRTSLGRFAHENCAFAPAVEGKPLVFYMGDDARGEYIYKFVSKQVWSSKDIGKGQKAGDKYLDEGDLYVAVFHENGTGQWQKLSYDNPKLAEFDSQADVVVHARLAADKLGATKMDRPEWVSVSPLTGEVYVTLTNNSKRTPDTLNAANPRSHDGKGNSHGHIIRFAEKDGQAGINFRWDIYLFASPHDKHAQNLSGLTAENDLSSPDGLFFDPRGVLWIQTDDDAYTKTTNCMLLAALPNQVGDGTSVITNAGQKTQMGALSTPETLKRFFVGPKGAEITGITMTADFKTLFINVQHPSGTWGAIKGGKTPRSATVVITKEDGGVILAESLDG